MLFFLNLLKDWRESQEPIGIWGIITFNDRCYRLDVNENAPPSQAIRGQRIFNSIPRNPILTEIPPIAGGQMP